MAQSLDRELVRCLAGQQAECRVELVRGEKAKHVGGDPLAKTDLDARMRLAEACEQPGQVEAAGRQERSDPDAPARDAAELVDLLACGGHLGEDAAGTSGYRPSCLGRDNAPARTLEQRSAELFFEPSDLV